MHYKGDNLNSSSLCLLFASGIGGPISSIFAPRFQKSNVLFCTPLPKSPKILNENSDMIHSLDWHVSP